MVSASTRTVAANPLASLTLSSSSSSSTTNSFAQQLAIAIKGYINQSLNGSQVGINVSEVAGQNSGGSQFLVTLTPAVSTVAAKAAAITSSAARVNVLSTAAAEIPTMLGMGPVAGTPPVTSKASPASVPATVNSAEIPTMLGMGPVPGATPVTSAAGGSSLLGTTAVSTVAVATHTSSGVEAATAVSTAPTTTKVPVKQATGPQPVSSPTETEADAYWAEQPAAVQVLRGMPDDDAKEKLALSLANQGYSIDTQIMVWNWDPQMTMQVRENQGYSWVPSFGQSNIPIGPGLSMPGDPNSYSPNSPPAGSIQVSTAFAVGTIQNPLVQVDPVST